MRTKLMLPRALRYFVAVAEHQSFTRAAEALCVSQPTLSQHIKHLEEVLGVQLLDRSGRAVRITDAGEVYLKHARSALCELEAGSRAIHDVQDLTRGELRLGITPVTEYLATSILDRFTARYPGITIRAMEMAQDEIETGIADNEIDVGLVFSSTLSMPARSVEIEAHTLFVEGLNVVVGKNHPLVEQAVSVGSDQLAQLPLALLSSKFALRRHFDLYCIEHNITPRIAIETNAINMIIQTVACGRHATILPNSVVDELPRLKALMVLPELPSHSVGIICRKGAYKSSACRAFGELAVCWAADRCRLPSNVDTCPMLETCAQVDKPCLAARP